MQDLDVGTKIQYRLFDKNNKEHWFDGIIHGVRSYEDKGLVRRVTYLVDTGRNVRVDEYAVNIRNQEIDRRTEKLVVGGKTLMEAFDEVSTHKDLPKDKIEIHRSRQPEQIELPAEHIRLI